MLIRPWLCTAFCSLIPGFLLALLSSSSTGSPAAAETVIPQCSKVTLSASYLAEVTRSDGPGFLLTVINDTDAAIRLARPFPTSAHFYAEAPGGRWLWRASSGSGGALVDALRERGPMFAYRPQTASMPGEYFTVQPHQHLEWAESVRGNPTLRYRPGCQRCLNPGDTQFRVVLAYAYLPAPGEPGEGLLSCGLRSNLVVMPPLE